MKPNILVVLGTTREGRRGIKVADWTMLNVSKRSDAKFELIDLRDWDFPFFNVPISPSTEKGKYESLLQKKWAKKIDSADGFIIITPEYNHGYTAALKNAMDYLWFEWNAKPVTFISYGGLSGGIRAVEQLRQVAIELEMIPIRHQVIIHRIRSAFDENGKLKDYDFYTKQLNSTVDALIKWSQAMRSVRKNLTY